MGANGSGKSALARAFTQDLPQLNGEATSAFAHPIRLSFEQLQKLLSDEWQRNNTDMLSEGEDDTGRTTAEIIQSEVKDSKRCQQLAAQFGIEPLLERRFKYLSTGETRKALLCQTLMSQPDLLVLDEPFDGLDVNSRAQLAQMLQTLNAQGVTTVLVLNRFDDIPDFIEHVGVLAECELTHVGHRVDVLSQALVAQLAHSESLADMRLPETEDPRQQDRLPHDQPRIILKMAVFTITIAPFSTILIGRSILNSIGKSSALTVQVNLRCSA